MLAHRQAEELYNPLFMDIEPRRPDDSTVNVAAARRADMRSRVFVRLCRYGPLFVVALLLASAAVIQWVAKSGYMSVKISVESEGVCSELWFDADSDGVTVLRVMARPADASGRFVTTKRRDLPSPRLDWLVVRRSRSGPTRRNTSSHFWTSVESWGDEVDTEVNVQRWRATTTFFRLNLMLCLLALAASSPAVVHLWKTRSLKKRRERGECIRCGYDLRSGHEKCPECGRVIERPAGRDG